MSDERRTIVPQIVTSSLFVTCMWQSWARGIIILGLGGGLRHSATIFFHFMVLSIVLYHVIRHL